jgi:hypothetical protein
MWNNHRRQFTDHRSAEPAQPATVVVAEEVEAEGTGEATAVVAEVVATDSPLTVPSTAATELARPAAALSRPTQAVATGASQLATTRRAAMAETAGPSLLPVNPRCLTFSERF